MPARFARPNWACSVALVEEDKLGGTCLHRGCIPTKALLHAGEVADSVREAAQFGVEATLSGVDLSGVNAYKDGVVSRLYKGLQGLVKSRGITQIDGHGTLVANERRRGRRRPLRGPCDRVGLRVGDQVAARAGDRRQAGHQQLGGDESRVAPPARDRARRRCDRRRVRVGVAVDGCRGHDHRGTAPARCRRGRGVVEGAGAGVPQARHRLQDRDAVQVRRTPRRTASP